MSNYRTDRNNNPFACTTDLAKQAGLELGKDYVRGDSFNSGASVLFTAKFLGNPIDLAIRVIDKVGFYTQSGLIRWIYIGMPKFVWDKLTEDDKVRVIQFMYHHEGGTELEKLFTDRLKG